MSIARLRVATTLGEAKFNDEEKTILVRVLSPGWSKNGNYYSPTIAASLAEKVKESAKSYIDHKQNLETKAFGRSLRDWAATVEDTFVESGVPYAKLRMTENPESAWLYEEAKKHPAEVGVSIDAQAKVTENGEADGRKGRIVDEIVSARCDLVAAPSAGGQVMQVLQSMGDVLEMEDMDGEKKTLPMSMMDVKTMQDMSKKRREENDKEWDLMDSFKTVMRNIHNPENAASDEDKAIAFDRALEELKNGLSQIDWKAVFADAEHVMASYGVDTELLGYVLTEVDLPEEVVEWSVITEAYTFSDDSWATINKAELEANDHLIVGDPTAKGTWHLPYKKGSVVYKGALRAISTILQSGKFRGKKISFVIPDDVKVKVEGLLKAAKIGQYAESVPDEAQITKEVGTMTDEEIKSAIAESLTPVLAKLGELDVSLKAVAPIIDRLDAADKAVTHRAKITQAAAEVGLPGAYLSEVFIQQLMNLSDETAIKEAITDRKALVFRTAGRAVDSGVTYPVIEAQDTTTVKDASGRLALFN